MRISVLISFLLVFVSVPLFGQDFDVCVECVESEGGGYVGSVPGSAPMGMMGGGFMGQNQMFDESGNIKDNDENVTTIAMSIGFNFYGGSERVDTLSASDRLNSVLEQYQLNNPENYDLRDKVLSEVSMSLAQREMKMSGGAFDMSVEFVTTDALQNFEQALLESGVQSPSGMSSAYALQGIAENAGDDHRAYLDAVDSQFYGDEKQKVLMNGMMRFDLDANSRKEYIDAIVEGEVNQDFLHMLLNQELNARNGLFGEETPGLLDLLSEHIDFDHEVGFLKENALCQNLSSSFFYTEAGQAQAQEAMAAYGMSSMEGGGFPGTGMGVGVGGGFGSYNGGGGETSEEFITPEPFPGDESYSYAPTMSLDEYKENMKKTSLETSQKNVATLLSMGADSNVICKDGMSASEKIAMLESEDLFKRELSSLYESGPKSGTPCVSHLEDSDFVGLCDTVSILATLKNNLRKNEKTREKGESNGELHGIYGEGTSVCNFVLLDKLMSFGGFAIGRDIQLEISPNGTNRSFVIKGKNKEEFLRNLETLIDQSK